MIAREVAATIAPQLQAAGIPDHEFEAELLTRTAGGISRAAYFARAEFPEDATNVLAEFVRRRLEREPAAYLLGRREFYGIAFRVGPGVLVPRPETELLVEAALEHLAGQPDAIVADLGTGSGCVAIAIAAHAPAAQVVGIDASAEALSVARANRDELGARVGLLAGDLASPLRRADVVVANLPYIPAADIASLQAEVRDWEPRMALDGGHDGLDLVRRLVSDCGDRLRPRSLALEVGAGQAPAVAALVAAAGGVAATTPDLAGIERMVTGRWT